MPLAQNMTTVTCPVCAKDDMSTDIQEDSSANKEELNRSKNEADETDNVKLGKAATGDIISSVKAE